MLVLASASATLAFCTASASALTPSSTPTGAWSVVGGQVSAVARSGNALYLGGAFQGLARRAPGIAAFNADSGELEGPTAQLDQLAAAPIRVTATTAAADGGVYVAGVFVGVGGARQQRLLRFAPSGALDRAFAPDVQGATDIRDMDLGGNGVLYIAGTLATVGGAQRTTLAAVDGATGALKAWQPALAGEVRQIEAGPDAVYLGGGFSEVGGVPRAHAAAVGLVDGATLPWRPDPNGTVAALALDGSTVYLGGDFTQVAGTDRFRLAAVAAGGTGALATWNPAPSGGVSRIAISASRVYVAGSFQRIGSQQPQPARRFLAALDKTSGEALPWDPLASRQPSDIAVANGRVYLAWRGGDALPRLADQFRCGLASVDADTGVPTSWNPSVEAVETTSGNCDPAQFYKSGTETMTLAGGRVWAGGDFGVANIRRRAGLAALDASTGQPLAWAPTLADVTAEVVQDLLPSADGATIYVGGRFARINGQTRKNAAAISATGAADTPGDLRAWDPAPDNAGGTGVVRALALSPGGLVYLGGNFVKAGANGLARTNLAAVDAVTGVAQLWRPNPEGGNVRDLLVDPATQRLLVAGSFTVITGSSTAPTPPPSDRLNRTGLAAVDIGPATGQAPVVTSWDAGLAAGAQVEGLALRGTELLAGGEFATPGGGPANLAAFDLATAALGPWRPQVDRRVSTVTVDPADSAAYITGAFTTAGGEPRAGAAAVGVDGAATGWDPAPSDNYPATTVEATPPGGVMLVDDRLLLTGLFTVLGARRQAGFAFFGAATAPVAVTPPRVTGTAKIGEAPLTCAPAAWAGDRGTLAIAWLRDDSVVGIPGQTSRTYTLTQADRGHVLRCRETMINAAASVEQVSAPTASVIGLPPALESPPAVGGQPWSGGVAQCTTGLWRNAPTDYRYQWALDGVAIPGATSDSFAVGDAERDHDLACEVTAANADGVSSAARSASVTITQAPPAALGTPLISGDARVGSTLTCLTGPWERARGFSYQWLRDRVPLVDAMSPTFVATSRDLGRALTCLVTADNEGGTASAESAAVIVAASARSVGTGRRPNPPDDDPASAIAAAKPGRIVLRSVRLHTASTLAIAVRTPAAGRISVTVVRGAASGAHTAKATTLTRGSRTLGRATAATVRLKLFTVARRLLTRAGKRGLRVSVRVSFRPASRSAATSRAQRSATLTRPSPATSRG